MSDSKRSFRHHSAEFKAQVVLELVRGDISLGEASRRYEIKDSMLSRWKKEFLYRAPMVFGQINKVETEQRLSDLEVLFKEQSLELAILKKAVHRSPKTSGDAS